MITDFVSFLSECIAHTDCPNGGSNYKCIANTCECLSPNLLDGNKCIGTASPKKLHPCPLYEAK